MTGKRGAENFASVQVARAMAASIVVFHHLEWALPATSPVVGKTPEWLSFGYAGVDIFFVISGFIIALVTENVDLKPGSFALRRFTRILPMYWLFTVAWVVLAWLGTREAPTVPRLIESLLVLPQRNLPVLGVGWSLEHEFIFYGLVAALLWAGKLSLLPRALCLLVVGSFGLQLVRGDNPPWDLHLLSPYWFDFLLGVTLFKSRETISRMTPWPLLAAGVALLIAGNIIAHQAYGNHVPTMPTGIIGLLRVVTLGASGFLLVAGGLALERRNRNVFENSSARALVEIGNSSYVLYLCHPLILKVFGAVLARRVPGSTVIQYLYALVVVAICLVVSVVISRTIERPLVKALNRPHLAKRVVVS